MSPSAVNVIIRNGIDPDARAYCLRSGATDRRVMSDWVRGVRGLGLSDSVIEYALLPGQSAGTGSTAYALRGGGAYDATLVDGPAWGTTGLVFNNNYVAINALAPLVRSWGGYSCVVVAKDTANYYSCFGTLKGSFQGGNADCTGKFSTQYNFVNCYQSFLTGGTSDRTFGTIASAIPAGFNFMGFARQGLSDPASDTGFVTLNGVTNSTKGGSGIAPSTNPYSEGFQLFGANGNGVICSFALVGKPLNAATLQALRALYKTTLGKGLGLP